MPSSSACDLRRFSVLRASFGCIGRVLPYIPILWTLLLLPATDCLAHFGDLGTKCLNLLPLFLDGPILRGLAVVCWFQNESRGEKGRGRGHSPKMADRIFRCSCTVALLAEGADERGLSWRGAQRRGHPSGILAGLPRPPSRTRNDKPDEFISRCAKRAVVIQGIASSLRFSQ